jgi:uncharacterized membrane protein YbhN (UPF0104 family)
MMRGRKITAIDEAEAGSPPVPEASAGAAHAARLQQSKRARLTFAIKLGAGLSLLALLLWHYDLRSTICLIERERADFFAAAVALFVAGQIMSAFRWQLLALLNGLEGPFREYLGYYFIGMFTNVFVPGLIGGDALRAIYLGRRHGRVAEALASVVADRGVGLLALFWLASGATVCATGVRLPPSMVRVTAAAGATSLLVYLAAPLVASLVLRLGGRFGRRLAPAITYMRRPVTLMPAILLSVLLQLSLAVCQYLLALGLGLPIRLRTFVLIVPIANVVASLPLTINGLGMREAAYLVLLGMAGIGKDQAVALSLLYFAATLTGGITGVVPFIMTPMPRLELTESSGLKDVPGPCPYARRG